ncbi:hypothetical protein GBA52_028353 [Prunus armeniaca]|nr:hypothetical protein GBA52_028353 [Prunus armeniaca]
MLTDSPSTSSLTSRNVVVPILLQPRSNSNFTLSSSLQASANTAALQQVQQEPRAAETSVLLDVSGMMCGGCVSRVKSVLSAGTNRVDSVMRSTCCTETGGAIKLRLGGQPPTE